MISSASQEPHRDDDDHHKQQLQLDTKPPVVELLPSLVHDENHDSVDLSKYNLELENNPSNNFTVDFEMDKSFLSEFLIDTDFPELSCFENDNNNIDQGGSSTLSSTTTCDKVDHSSPTFINHALLVSKETEMNGSEDFQPMAPLIGSDDQYLDWLFVSKDTISHGSEENSDHQSKLP